MDEQTAPDVRDVRDLREARHRAFERYVLPEIGVLLRVAGSLTAQPADAEDLVQDTLLRAFRAAHRFDGRHPRAWLLTIMRRAQLNRTRRRRPHLLDDPDAEEFDRLAFPPGSTAPAIPEEVVVGEMFDAEVEAAVAALPQRYRETVLLVDAGGLSYAQAAYLLEIPEGTVMSRLHRARKRIRARLAAAGLAPARPSRRDEV